MNISEYIRKNAVKKVPADIVERWQTRVVSRRLNELGRQGAEIYLRDYGKGIAAKKCFALGQMAVNQNAAEMAAGFYRKAAELEGVELSDVGNVEAARTTTAPIPVEVRDDGFPDHLQPGKLAPMQPVDALHDKAHYVSDQAYWGQPKIDGHKLIVFASPDNRYYQSRSMKLSSAPGAEMDLAFKQTAAKIGNFILEGELTFLDHNGGQHRTGSQAANAEGNTDKTVRMVYYVFSALYAGHCALKTYGDCVLEGRMIAAELREICSDIDFCETSRMSTSKQLLIEQNEKEDREGEIWFNPMLTYSPGKRNDDMFVRTKRLTEFEAIVTGLTDTTAQGHAFGAMEVSDLNGKPVGAIGTGFTLHEKAEIKKRFENGRLKVSIVSQGFTESGMAWHGRFAGFV